MTAAIKPDYTTLPPGMTAFPDSESIFVLDQQDLAKHLLPLFTIDLHTVNPDWVGDLYMLSPLEPYEGLVGDLTESMGVHTELVRTNWIGFTIERGRYRLCGDSRFFFLHEDNDLLPEPVQGIRDELAHHYEDQIKAYQAAKEFFRAHNTLARRDDSRVEFVAQIGGQAAANANWVGLVDFPMVKDGTKNTVYPLSPSGHRFFHVASVPGWHYSSAGADMIILFYEPVEGIVLFTFDWS